MAHFENGRRRLEGKKYKELSLEPGSRVEHIANGEIRRLYSGNN